MITIDYLANHPNAIEQLSHIWCEVLGKVWIPNMPIEAVIDKFHKHLNSNILPLTFVAFCEGKPVGMCSLRENDGIRPDLTPWLASLVVDSNFQNRGIGKLLIDAVKEKALALGFNKLYLFAFDKTIPNYYQSLGWKTIDMDTYNDYPVTVMEVGL